MGNSKGPEWYSIPIRTLQINGVFYNNSVRSVLSKTHKKRVWIQAGDLRERIRLLKFSPWDPLSSVVGSILEIYGTFQKLDLVVGHGGGANCVFDLVVDRIKTCYKGRVNSVRRT